MMEEGSYGNDSKDQKCIEKDSQVLANFSW